MTVELNDALQTIWEELPQEHVNKAVANFIKRLTATWLWLPTVVTLSICSNYVHLQVCVLMSSSTNRLFSERPTTTGEDNDRNAEKWGGLSWLKQHNFVTFRYVLTKVGCKVYIIHFKDNTTDISETLSFIFNTQENNTTKNTLLFHRGPEPLRPLLAMHLPLTTFSDKTGTQKILI